MFDAIFKSMQWIQRDDTYDVGGYKTTRSDSNTPQRWCIRDECLFCQESSNEEKPLDKWPLYNYLISMTLASDFILLGQFSLHPPVWHRFRRTSERANRRMSERAQECASRNGLKNCPSPYISSDGLFFTYTRCSITL